MFAVAGLVLMVLGTLLLVGDPAGGTDLVLPGVAAVFTGAILLVIALLFATRLGGNRLPTRRRRASNAPVSVLDPPPGTSADPDLPQPGSVN